MFNLPNAANTENHGSPDFLEILLHRIFASAARLLLEEGTTMSLFHGALPAGGWTYHEYADSQGTDAVCGADVSPLPESDEHNTIPIETLIETTETSPNQQRYLPPEGLSLLQLADWDQEKTYDEEPPCCIHYSIEWKVIINNKVVSDNTEQNLVLAPASYWQLFLQPNLAEVLRRKASRNRNVRCDDTKVVVSVMGRSERPFKKTFRDTEIDWSVVEKKLTRKSLRPGVSYSGVVRNSEWIFHSTSWRSVLNQPIAPQRREIREVHHRPPSGCSRNLTHRSTLKKRVSVNHRFGVMYTVSYVVPDHHVS